MTTAYANIESILVQTNEIQVNKLRLNGSLGSNNQITASDGTNTRWETIADEHLENVALLKSGGQMDGKLDIAASWIKEDGVNLKKINRILYATDTTTYSTANTTSYAGLGSYTTVTPTNSACALFVWSTLRVETSDASSLENNIGILLNMGYYTGSAYATKSYSNWSSLRDMDEAALGSQIMYGQAGASYSLPYALRRSDTDDWMIRWLFNATYTGNTVYCKECDFIMIEYE